MLSLEPEIFAEYQRCCEAIGEEEGYPSGCGLGIHDVLRAHFLIANHFYLQGEGMGGVGPKNVNLLHSAVHRQYVGYGGKPKWTDKFDITATLFYGIIKNHPFYDANKRTAFLCALYQLDKLGYCPSVPQERFEDFTVEIAENGLERYDRYEEMVRSGDADPEVRYISHFLRRNTRKIDKRSYRVTYRELNAILRRSGFALENPQGNYIDVVQIRKRKPYFGLFGKERSEHVRIGQIGFPRWTQEVGKTDIKAVREMTNLTHRDGVDSASFFHGVDPMQSLIATYHGPLQRLAGR